MDRQIARFWSINPNESMPLVLLAAVSCRSFLRGVALFVAWRRIARTSVLFVRMRGTFWMIGSIFHPIDRGGLKSLICIR